MYIYVLQIFHIGMQRNSDSISYSMNFDKANSELLNLLTPPITPDRMHLIDRIQLKPFRSKPLQRLTYSNFFSGQGFY